MEPVQIKPDIYWVGAIDWNLREFHGYHTPRGTTYNAYLIMDRDITLIDTVKAPFYPELLERITKITDPTHIKYIVSNHVEMDHSGSLPQLLTLLPNATLITSTKGALGLTKHYHTTWPMKVVKTDETLTIGRRTLLFHHIPMVHWPDSMVTYSPTDSLLLPNDAFGQHIACAQRFDDQIGWDILNEEAAAYYANIVQPYSDQVTIALKALSTLKFDMIAPSHGAIWRRFLTQILDQYHQWSTYQTQPTAVVVYDTMWGSTYAMACAIRDGLEAAGIPVTMRSLKTSHPSDVMTSILSSRLICIGSPTLNSGILPSIGGFLSYLRGLKPKHRIGLAFGSYGWSGQSITDIETTMKDLAWDMPVTSLKINYVPEAKDLKTLRETATQLGNYLKQQKIGIRTGGKEEEKP